MYNINQGQSFMFEEVSDSKNYLRLVYIYMSLYHLVYQLYNKMCQNICISKHFLALCQPAV